MIRKKKGHKCEVRVGEKTKLARAHMGGIETNTQNETDILHSVSV